MKLEGKVALVTGASRGVGRSVALALGREGATVIVNFRESRVEAEETVRELVALQCEAMAIQADVADDSAVRRMVETIVRAYARVDVLVNNAGMTNRIPMTDLEGVAESAWDRIMDVNVRGAFNCSRAVAPVMKALGQGVIVNIASVAGITGDGSSIPYVVSKAALIGLTKALAVALAPEIVVNAIAPGFMPTAWNTGKEAWHDRIAREAPLKRLGQPEDVARLAVALAADVTFVTGMTVVVDGGKTRVTS